MVLALKERASKESDLASKESVVGEEEVEEQYGDLAIWLQQRFNGYFSVLVKIIFLAFDAELYTFTIMSARKIFFLLDSNFLQSTLDYQLFGGKTDSVQLIK